MRQYDDAGTFPALPQYVMEGCDARDVSRFARSHPGVQDRLATCRLMRPGLGRRVLWFRWTGQVDLVRTDLEHPAEFAHL
jgi:hypothetical protein